MLKYKCNAAIQGIVFNRGCITKPHRACLPYYNCNQLLTDYSGIYFPLQVETMAFIDDIISLLISVGKMPPYHLC